MCNRYKDLLIPFAAIAVAIVFFIAAGEIPETQSTISVGPAFWPRAVTVLLMVFGVILVLKAVAKNRKLPAGAGNSPEEPGVKEARPQNLWISFIALAVYACTLNIIGFVLATFSYFAFNVWIMGIRRLAILVPVVFLLTGVLVWLFPYTLSVPLPRGSGVFRNLTLLFY
ncbi:MAG: tripartite tricarboxylate transporter TctB family protein [Peptococcaceae bacterium]